MRICLVLLLLLIIEPILNQLTRHRNIFLADNQASLFFTHRNFQFISTYMSTCQAKPTQLVKHHPSMNIISSFNFNNSNMGINILGQGHTATTVFHYAKININGICSIYQVDKSQIHILFQYNFGGEFAHVIMLDKYHAFLWNTLSFLRMEYLLFNKQISILRSNFQSEEGRICQKYKENIIICWGSSEIIFITIDNYQIETQVYKLEDQSFLILKVLVLEQDTNIILICSFMICNVVRLNQDHTMQIIQTNHLINKFLGADFNSQTNKIVIIHSTAAAIFLYNWRQSKLDQKDFIIFNSDVQCIFIENVRFLNEQILVNCNNFMGQAQHLIMIWDKQLDRFFSYQPFENSDPTNPCLFDGNIRYIFAVCKKNIITRMNNFQFFEINLLAKDTTIKIECFDNTTQQVKEQMFQLSVIYVEYNNIYINQLIPESQIINYDASIQIVLKSKFTASAIDSYLIQSPNCQFIKPIQHYNIETIYYISLFNSQKCIQILAAVGVSFYRVLQINETVFYIQLCSSIKISYGCQLQSIIDEVFSLKLFLFDNYLYKCYIAKGNLILESEEETVIIFEEVVTYQIKEKVIRVFSKDIYYSKSVANIVNNCGDWIEQSPNSTYIYSQSSIFEVDSLGVIKEHISSKQIKTISPKISQIIKVKKNKQIIFPYMFWREEYLFIIGQNHITKLYLKEQIIIIYRLPYNSQQYEIQSIKNVENYLTIQYSLGFFELYDLQRQSIAALVAIEQEQVLCDIIIMGQNIVTVPIRQQNYVLFIQTNPTLSFGPFPLSFSMFREECSFTISPRISNGSCPTRELQSNITVSQTFNLSIRFNIQKIALQNQISIINQPSQCQNCQFQIQQNIFMGPIFSYEFNDDEFGAFSLITYLNIEECQDKEEISLQAMTQIRSSDQSTQRQILMMNKTHLLLIDESLTQIYKAQVLEQLLCVSYTTVQSYYLVLCRNFFLLFNKTIQISKYKHNLSINSSNQYSIKLQFISENNYNIYILDEIVMHIFVLTLQNLKIEYSTSQEVCTHINDFDIVNSNIVTLSNKQICISTSKIWKYSCYNLTSFIPRHYANDYQYEEFITYFSMQNSMRALMISKSNENLHIDVQIRFQTRQLVFRILNVYAGYLGFTLKGIISINRQAGGYTNFILHYEDLSQVTQSSIIAYYQYNSRYPINRYIGQIRQAIFLQNYFGQPYSFSFLSFTHRLYISHLAGSQRKGLMKQCILVKVEDTIRTISNYNSPPLLKFLILKSKNINDLLPLYIKINYQYQNHLLRYSLIGLGSMIALFVILIIATNRCKQNDSQLTIHFISEQIEKEFSEDSSDLLHSKSSPRSNGSPLSEPHSNQDD